MVQRRSKIKRIRRIDKATHLGNDPIKDHLEREMSLRPQRKPVDKFAFCILGVQ